MGGILSQVRAEGYREGMGQASMLFHEDDYWEGVAYARSQQRSRHRLWFVVGSLFGAAIASIAWWLA